MNENKKYRYDACRNITCPSQEIEDEEEQDSDEEEDYDNPFKYLPRKDTHPVIISDDLAHMRDKLPCTTPSRSPSPIRHSESNPLAIPPEDIFLTMNLSPYCPAYDPKFNRTLRYAMMMPKTPYSNTIVVPESRVSIVQSKIYPYKKSSFMFGNLALDDEEEDPDILVRRGACPHECHETFSPGYDVTRPCNAGFDTNSEWSPYTDGRFGPIP